MKIKLTSRYFAYMGKHFPVMCSSGAFPLLPPVADAANRLDRFDDLSKKGISRHVAKLTKFKRDFNAAESKAKTPEDRAVANALALSASGAIAELDGIRSWQKSPEVYLQVAFTGLVQASEMPSKTEKEREKRFIKRLKALPSLLAIAPHNIEAISTTSRGIAQTMVRDCARYLTELGESDLGKNGKAPRFLQECLSALRDFDKFILARPELPEDEGPAFEDMLVNVAGTHRPANEIYAIAEKEYHSRLESLSWLESEIGSNWREAFTQYAGSAEKDIEAMDLVIREMHLLRAFIFDTALPGVFNDSRCASNPSRSTLHRHSAPSTMNRHWVPGMTNRPAVTSARRFSPAGDSGTIRPILRACEGNTFSWLPAKVIRDGICLIPSAVH